MGRFFFILLASAPFLAAWIVLNHLFGWQPDPDFVGGMGVAAVIGYFYFRLSEWNYESGAHKRPQFVAQPTRETPEQVMQRAFAARLRMIAVTVGIVLASVVVIYVATQTPR